MNNHKVTFLGRIKGIINGKTLNIIFHVSIGEKTSLMANTIDSIFEGIFNRLLFIIPK